MLASSQARVLTVSGAIFAAVVCPSWSRAAEFTLTPVTNTTRFYAGIIQITGTITLGPGESLAPPGVSAFFVPYNASHSANLSAADPAWAPAFTDWIRAGTYTGPILNLVIPQFYLNSLTGMPDGLYDSNPNAANGLSHIRLTYLGADSLPRTLIANYAVNVVPAPGAVGVFGLSALLASSRRRQGGTV